MNAYSFCIITDGEEVSKTLRLIASIHAQGIPIYETLIAGNVPAELSRVVDITLSMPEEARLGRLGAMRNALCREAHGDILVVLDDDLMLDKDWFTGMLKCGEDKFDILSCRILNPDRSRFWDWKTYRAGVNELLPYNETSPDVSLTGGLTIMARAVFSVVQWDETKGFYECEDVDFTTRLKAAGVRIAFNPHSTVFHDAPYHQVGRFVIRS